MSYGLTELLRQEARPAVEVLGQAVFDGRCPAICTECGYITEMEPDQDAGWCDECDGNTVVSALVLAGWA